MRREPQTNESLRLAHDEAVRVLDRLLEVLAHLDAKSAQLMTLSATLGALLLAGVSIVAGDAQLDTAFELRASAAVTATASLSASAVLLVGALLGSAMAYSTGDLPQGLRPAGLAAAVREPLSSSAFHRASLAAYLGGIRLLERRSHRAAIRLRLTLAMFLAGVAFAAAGGAILIAVGGGLGP